MTPKHWTNNTIHVLEEEGFSLQSGAPLLAFSQYALEPLEGAFGSHRVLEVSRVHDGECILLQVWWSPGAAVDIHVTIIENFKIKRDWMISGLHPELAYDLVTGFAGGLPMPGPEDVVSYPH